MIEAPLTVATAPFGATTTPATGAAAAVAVALAACAPRVYRPRRRPTLPTRAWLALAVLVVITMGRTPRAGADEESAFGLAHRAKEAYARRDFAEAARLYRAAYAADPSHPEALYGVGRAEQRAGRCPEALQALRRLALALPPGDPLLERAAAVRRQCAAGDSPVVRPSGSGAAGSSEPAPPSALPTEATATARSLPGPAWAGAERRVAKPPAAATPRWLLPAGLGLLAGGAGAGGYAWWATSDLDRQLGRLDGESAAGRQRRINAWSLGAAAAVVSGAAVLAWHLLAEDGGADADKVAPASTADRPSQGPEHRGRSPVGQEAR